MEDRQRILIKENLDGLTSKTDYDELIIYCIQQKIITQIMKENLELNFKGDKKERHRELFIKITKRGPKAFDALRNILIKNFPSAEKILAADWLKSIPEEKRRGVTETIDKTEDTDRRTVLREYFKNKTNISLKVYEKETQHDKNIIVKKSKKIHYDEKVQTYSMRSRNRGVLFMINIITFPLSTSDLRKGATMDGDNLIHLFREFGFDVFYYENLNLEEFHGLLDEMLQSEHARNTECFVMALMSHGTNTGKDYVEFHDSAVESVENIIQKFGNAVCPNLLGKPKILFFPFCRGDISDKGTYAKEFRGGAQTDGINRNPAINHPSISDLMICYATVPGYRTHRDESKGSWYIQCLCEIWSEHAHNTDIEKLQKLVGEKTGLIRLHDGSLQTSSQTVYGFYKALYFNPGFYED